MAGPKSSSVAAHQQQQQHSDAPAGGGSSSSYKAKLLAPSSNDELSAPDQTQPEPKPKLPPSKDAGSPPMVPAADEGAPTPVTDSSDVSHPHTAPVTGSNIVSLPDSEHNQLAKGDLAEDSSSGSSGSSDAAAATAAPGSSDAISGDSGSSDGQGAKGASSAAAAVGGGATAGGADDSSSQPIPAAVEGLAGDTSGETASPAAAAVPDTRAKAAAAAELPEMGGKGPAITPADFAATGLAALEAEADSAAAAAAGGGSTAAAAAADRSTSVMTDRTDSGWYERSYSSMMPSSAVELAGMDKSPGMEPLSEKSEDPFSDDPEARKSFEKSETGPTEKSESSGPPQGYPALAQAPAVSGDAAAEPAPPQPASAFAADAAKGPEQQQHGEQEQQQGGEEEGSGGEGGAAAGAERVFAGQGSGKESGRGGVTVNAADLEEAFLREEGEGEQGPATPPSADTAGKDSAAPAGGGSTQVAAAPAGEKAEGEQQGELQQEVEELPLPLKMAGGAAKAVIDTVADVGEAVKDAFLGPDI